MKRLAALLTLMAGPLAAEDLIIATGGHYPPYIFAPGTPDAIGLDKDIVDEICDRGGFTCTWVDLPMDNIFERLAAGEVDIVTGGFGYSVERDAIVDFTCPYVRSGEDSGDFIARTPEVDLVNARIGVLVGSLYESAMRKANREVITYPTEEAALAALASGDIDVVFGSHNAWRQVQDTPGFFDVGDYPTFSGGSVLGVAETAPELLTTLDDILADMSADGTLSRLQVQWLGEDQGDVIAQCQNLDALT